MSRAYFPTFARLGRRLCPPWWRRSGAGFQAGDGGSEGNWVRGDKEAVLRLMGVAARHRIPLAPILDSFARDVRRRDQPRIQRLAAELASGTPLAEALEQNPRLATDSTLLAIRTGMQTGTLGRTLQAATAPGGDSNTDHQLPGDFTGNLVYVAFVLLTITLLIAFLAIKITPTFESIMHDMHVEAPAAFRRGITALRIFGQWWWLGALAVTGIAFLALSGRMQRSFNRGWLGQLFQPWLGNQTADVLRNLSVVSDCGRPLASAISTMARYHDCPSIRHRLLFVRNELEHNVGLWPSMHRVHLVNGRELKLLETATRVGNVPWVLRQIAMQHRNSAWQRRQALAQIVFPVCIVMLGGLVLWVGLVIFTPIINMIAGIA